MRGPHAARGDPLPDGRGDRRRPRGGARGGCGRADREEQLDRRARPGDPFSHRTRGFESVNLTAREHRDRARLDLRLPRRRRALPEHARRAALRQLRLRELQGSRRHRLPRLLRAPQGGAGAADDVAADAAGLPRRLRGARGLRADLRAAAVGEALRHLPVGRHRGRARSEATGSASSTPRPRRSRSGCSRSRSSAGSRGARPTRRSRR